MDGSSTQHVGGIGVMLQSLDGDKLTYKVRLQYQTTNNEVEYEALLKVLELGDSHSRRFSISHGSSKWDM